MRPAALRAAQLAVLAAMGLIVAACVSISSDREIDGVATSRASALPSATAPSTAPASASLTPASGSPTPGNGSPIPASGSPIPASGSPTPGNGSAVPGTGSPAPPTAAPTPAPSLSVDPSIGYIALDDDVPYLSAVSDGIRGEAASVGIDLVECDSGWSREGTLDCARRLREAGVHGVISVQAFDDATTEVCELVGGVPTIGVVFDQGPCQVARLEIDQAESGRLAGAAMGEFARGRWDCAADAYVSLESSDADPDGRARMQGFRDGYRQYCALPEAVHSLDGAVRVATARTQVRTLLRDLKGERIVVVGLNEDAILGAMAAAAAAGREGDLWYSGQLADPSIREHIACNEHYVASVAQFPERFGTQVVPALKAVLDGADVPPQLEAQLELVDSRNVRELYPDTPPCGG